MRLFSTIKKMTSEEAQKKLSALMKELQKTDVPHVVIGIFPSDEGCRQTTAHNGSISNLGPHLAVALCDLVRKGEMRDMWRAAIMTAATQSGAHPLGALLGMVIGGINMKADDKPKASDAKVDGKIITFPGQE